MRDDVDGGARREAAEACRCRRGSRSVVSAAQSLYKKLTIYVGGKGGTTADTSITCVTSNGKSHTFAGMISG